MLGDSHIQAEAVHVKCKSFDVSGTVLYYTSAQHQGLQVINMLPSLASCQR